MRHSTSIESRIERWKTATLWLGCVPLNCFKAPLVYCQIRSIVQREREEGGRKVQGRGRSTWWRPNHSQCLIPFSWHILHCFTLRTAKFPLLFSTEPLRTSWPPLRTPRPSADSSSLLSFKLVWRTLTPLYVVSVMNMRASEWKVREWGGEERIISN